jgi:hypothetical protein
MLYLDRLLELFLAKLLVAVPGHVVEVILALLLAHYLAWLLMLHLERETVP